ASERSAGRLFDVPRANLIPDSARPFFLPPSRDGFIFKLNPEAALPEQVIIGVESKADVCARAAGSHARANTTICNDHQVKWRAPLQRSGDDTIWSYTAGEAGKTSVIVGCFKATNGGLCTSALPWRDQVLNISFRDT